jgi:hypothetical protein
MKLFARRRWPLVEATLIDRRHIKRFLVRFDATSQLVSVDEYMVEFPGAGGKPTRLAIKAKSVHLPSSGLHVGQKVPIHVNRTGKQAVFGCFEPRDADAQRKQREKEQRAKDEQRFKEKLGET